MPVPVFFLLTGCVSADYERWVKIMRKERLHKALLITVLVICCVLLLFLIGFMLWMQGAFAPEPDTVPSTSLSDVTETTETEPTTEPTEPPIALNRFVPENFEFQGDYLTCNSEWYLLGIDVSKYQGNIDWQQVKEAGMSFAMIRVGYRGYGQAGNMLADDMAQANYWGAKNAGLMVGAYFFSQATTVEEAVEEAKMALELKKDWDMELPIVFDWEYIGAYARTADVSDRMLTDCAIAFCEEIKAAGRKPMIYVAPWFGKLILEDLNEYPQWLALYTGKMTYRYHFDMWQYTCTSTVPGVTGDCDVNIFFPYDDLK